MAGHYEGDVDLEAKLDEWERIYNYARLHGAFNGNTITRCYARSSNHTQRCPGTTRRLHAGTKHLAAFNILSIYFVTAIGVPAFLRVSRQSGCGIAG